MIISNDSLLWFKVGLVIRNWVILTEKKLGLLMVGLVAEELPVLYESHVSACRAAIEVGFVGKYFLRVVVL